MYNHILIYVHSCAYTRTCDAPFPTQLVPLLKGAFLKTVSETVR